MGEAEANSKATEKRLGRINAEERCARVIREDAAGNVDDPLEKFPSFRRYEKNDIQVELSAKRLTDLDAVTKEWVVELIRKNMKELYEKSDCGWEEPRTREEMLDDRAWYLIARSTASEDVGKLVAFSHFCFKINSGDEVLFVYEIQLEEYAMGKGLGKFMMHMLETMAFEADMRKIMLKSFKKNPATHGFFKDALKYELDELCQTGGAYEHLDYEILLKMNKRILAKGAKEMLECLNSISSPPVKVQIETPKASLKNDCRSPPKNDNFQMNLSCGQNAMFPMAFGYEEAKSPRSPLGDVNLNANFKASPVSKVIFPMTFGYKEAKSPRSPLGSINVNVNFKVSPISMSKSNTTGDFKPKTMGLKNEQNLKPQRLSMKKGMGDLTSDHLY